MITVALAATAYVWFSQVFTTVTEGGTEVTERGVIAVQTAFALESAKNVTSSNITVSVRNTGSAVISMSTAAAYINDNIASITAGNTGTLSPGSVTQLNVTGTGNFCGATLKISFSAGTPQTRSITC